MKFTGRMQEIRSGRIHHIQPDIRAKIVFPDGRILDPTFRNCAHWHTQVSGVRCAMKEQPVNRAPNPEKKSIEVPRDERLDRGDGPTMPSADGQAMRDEDYTDRDKPLLASSVEAKRLQHHPPKGKDQLRVGTAGDAGRPTKEGIEGKPIPPRGNM